MNVTPLERRMALAYHEAYEAAPVMPWDEGAGIEAQDWSAEVAGLRAALAVYEAERPQRPELAARVLDLANGANLADTSTPNEG